jgi:hypothetical protein
MADIYPNAHVVEAATRASHMDKCFLQVRRPVPNIPVGPLKRPIFVVRATRFDHHSGEKWGKAPSQFPLSERGWAFQRRLLATRTIYFLRDEILFSCQDGLRCECGWFNHDDLPVVDAGTWPPTVEVEEVSPADFSWHWSFIVEDLSDRQLTYQDDALPALSGLAQLTLTSKTLRFS